MTTCPHCHQTIRATRPAKPTLVVPVETESMSHAELYAHFKATAPLEDSRSFLKHCERSAYVSAALIASVRVLYLTAAHGKINRPIFYREYNRLQCLWRGEAEANDRRIRRDAGHVLMDSAWMVVDPDVPGSFMAAPHLDQIGQDAEQIEGAA